MVKTINTESSKTENQKGFNFSWSNVIKYTIITVVILGIIKVVTQLFGSLGPLWKGMEEVLGAGANVVNGITNNCKAQAECSKISTNTSCETEDTCTWNPPEEGGKEGSCVGKTGQKEGDGGFFSTKCGLGIGAIIYACGLVFTGLLKIIASALTRNDNIKTAGRLNGKGTAETLKDVVDKTIEVSTEIETDALKDKEPLTDAELKLVASEAANNSSTGEVIDNLKNNQDSQRIANEAITNQIEIDAKIIETAKENKIETDRIEELKDRVEDKLDPVEVKLISKMIQFNLTPNPQTLAYLMDKTKKNIIKGKSIEPQHMNFLKKFMQ